MRRELQNHFGLGETRRQRRDAARQKTQAAQPASAKSLRPTHPLQRARRRVKVEARRELPGISAQRAEIIVAGGQILEGVMHASSHLLRTCDWALREASSSNVCANGRPGPDLLVRSRGSTSARGHAVGRRFGYEEAPSHQYEVCRKVIRLPGPGRGLTRHDRTLLSAAALLHDVGYHIAQESHHKHTLYLIKNSN